MFNQIKHHSIDNWIFEDLERFNLDHEIYVSGPTSLWAPKDMPAYDYPYIYLNIGAAVKVSQGRFITWWRMQPMKQLAIKVFFRQQLPLVHAGNQNGYVVFIETWAPKQWKIKKYLDGVVTNLYTGPDPQMPWEQWNRFMVEFYDFVHPTQGLTTRISLFVEENSKWVSRGYFDDYDPYFTDADINRIGFAPLAHDIFTHDWIDDTEIWDLIA